MFNIDRWANYTRQHIGKSWKGNRVPTLGWLSTQYYGDWCMLTPRQRRRMVKKMKKNSDYSIGLY